jgi:hypothetical protein
VLFHAARLNLRRSEPLDPSLCMTFSAMWRKIARLQGLLSIRLPSWSSFMMMSRRQWRRFSIPQCERTTALKRLAVIAALSE